jgi:DNA-binding CsgD family transcriptional regulator
VTGAEIPARLIRALERAPLVAEAVIDHAPVCVNVTELTKRERETLTLISHGCTLLQAAEALGIGYETARTHRDTARFKLRAKNTTHAVAKALRGGIIA